MDLSVRNGEWFNLNIRGGIMEKYFLQHFLELNKNNESDETECNSIYEFMQNRSKHKVRLKEKEFKASDVPLIKVSQLKKKEYRSKIK